MFKPKAVAAIKEKQRLGIIPKNLSNPQNIVKQIPNLVPINPIATNPLASATMSAFRPQVPGMPIPKIGTPAALRRFGNLRKKLSGR